MEIKIKRIGEPKINGDPGASDVTNTYRVLEDGRGFKITFRAHKYGASLGIEGKDGVLYTDHDTGLVHMQVLAVGRGCGIGVESDEVVEGLSPWSIRGVHLAGRTGETREITLIAEVREGSGDVSTPKIFIDGQITDLGQGV